MKSSKNHSNLLIRPFKAQNQNSLIIKIRQLKFSLRMHLENPLLQFSSIKREFMGSQPKCSTLFAITEGPFLLYADQLLDKFSVFIPLHLGPTVCFSYIILMIMPFFLTSPRKDYLELKTTKRVQHLSIMPSPLPQLEVATICTYVTILKQTIPAIQNWGNRSRLLQTFSLTAERETHS